MTNAVAYAIGDRGQGRKAWAASFPKKRKKYQLEDLQKKTQRDPVAWVVPAPVAFYSDAHPE